MDIQTCQTLKTAGKCLEVLPLGSWLWLRWSFWELLWLSANWVTQQNLPRQTNRFSHFTYSSYVTRYEIRLCAWSIFIVRLEILNQSECENSTRLENRMMSGKIPESDWKRRWTKQLISLSLMLTLFFHFNDFFFCSNVSYAIDRSSFSSQRLCVDSLILYRFEQKNRVKAIPSNNSSIITVEAQNALGWVEAAVDFQWGSQLTR